MPAAARPRRPPGSRQPASQHGFSMVEALIATAIIGFVAVGLIPLFTRSLIDNMAGADYTRVSNYSRSEEEDFYRQPFSNDYSQIVLGPGATAVSYSGSNTAQFIQYVDPTSKQWVTVTSLAAVPSNPQIVWTRTVTFRQYDVADLLDDQIFDNPLTPGSGSVNLIEATVQIQARTSDAVGPAGGRRSTTIRYLKAF